MPNEAQDAVHRLAKAFVALKEAPKVANFLTHCDPIAECDDPPKTRLLFPRFGEDSPDMRALAEFLWFQAINYVIPLRKRRSAVKSAKDGPTGGDLSLSVRLVNETKRAFLKFNAEYPDRASEVGELLAYIVALEYIGAAQIASKMALKTNGNMPVHGLDGIHARFDNGVMTLYFLESKLAATANAGAKNYAESVAGFGSNRKQYLLEYEIISDLSNLDTLAPKDRDVALTYLDVYGDNKGQRLERSVGLICYTETTHYKSKLPKSEHSPPSDHENHFRQNYSAMQDHHRNATIKHLQNASVSPDDCQVFFVAVPDIDQFRESFYEVMNG